MRTINKTRKQSLVFGIFMELQSDKYDLNTTMNSYNPVHPEQTVSKSNGDKHAWNVQM